MSPNLSSAEYWLVITQRDQGQLALADSTLDQFLRREPRNEKALEAKVDTASRRTGLRRRPDRTDKGSAKDSCQVGDLLLRTRQIKAAEAPLEQGLERDPYSFLCHRDLGELYRATARNSDAIRELVWVVRYYPEADSRAYASLALAYGASGDAANARDALENGRRIFPLDSLLQELELRH